MQLHLPMPAFPPLSTWATHEAVTVAICRRRERWMDSGGGNVWPRFISLRSTPDRAKTMQPTQPKPGRTLRSQTLFVFFSCIRRTSNCCSPLSHTLQGFLSLCLFMEPWHHFTEGKDGEETRPWGHRWAAQPAAPLCGEVVRRIWVFPPSTKVFIPNRNSVKWAEEDRTANYCHCVPIGCHPCLPANRIVFR